MNIVIKWVSSMDLSRKIRIGLGAVILIAAALNESPLYMAGIFLIVSGVFNLCPACTTCNDGSCDIDPKKGKEKELNNERIKELK